MKIQFISLLLVASVAMSRPFPSSLSSNAALDRRTLIGDEYAVSNQVDNSYGKKILRVDHNGDSVHKGLLYDLIDPSRNAVDNDDTAFQFRRRSLLGDLFGGDSMSISNQNDNSKHTQTKNEHDNRYTTITKIHKDQEISNDNDDDEDDMLPESFFDKRDADITTATSASLDRRGLLFGGESTTINNVNDNSKHTQTMNVHNNRDTTITKLHNHQQSASSRRRRHGPRRGDATIPKGFFDRRDDNSEPHDMDRRSLLGDLFDGKSMSISNVNDNSQTKKTLNSHGNRNTHITKIHKTTKSTHGDDSGSGSFFDKRGLLFGGESMVINNENDNSQTKKTLNSHGNRNTRLTRIHKSSHGSDSSSNFFDKRGLLFGDQSTTITNQNDNSQNKKTLNSHHNHNHNNFDETSVEKNMHVVEDGF
ncbi:hypothetical protein BG015_008300 [Linnemannia schmuckeri]|uniref:Uncharacterized protein n=1 Tax=Linnemannia schmuckeri TaxID=64567 RepID=A0A9P5RX56_9FUNG|nr:hypothetical protein BG015_008300 [Linnemannia schmuckeri]